MRVVGMGPLDIEMKTQRGEGRRNGGRTGVIGVADHSLTGYMYICTV